jgi:hypothetical protein
MEAFRCEAQDTHDLQPIHNIQNNRHFSPTEEQITDYSDLIGSLEAATILGVNRATFNRWVVKDGGPVAVKAPGIRGACLFRSADIEALAKQRAA